MKTATESVYNPGNEHPSNNMLCIWIRKKEILVAIKNGCI